MPTDRSRLHVHAEPYQDGPFARRNTRPSLGQKSSRKTASAGAAVLCATSNLGRGTWGECKWVHTATRMPPLTKNPGLASKYARAR